jgi:hypothetical protein
MVPAVFFDRYPSWVGPRVRGPIGRRGMWGPVAGQSAIPEPCSGHSPKPACDSPAGNLGPAGCPTAHWPGLGTRRRVSRVRSRRDPVRFPTEQQTDDLTPITAPPGLKPGRVRRSAFAHSSHLAPVRNAVSHLSPSMRKHLNPRPQRRPQPVLQNEPISPAPASARFAKRTHFPSAGLSPFCKTNPFPQRWPQPVLQNEPISPPSSPLL